MKTASGLSEEDVGTGTGPASVARDMERNSGSGRAGRKTYVEELTARLDECDGLLGEMRKLGDGPVETSCENLRRRLAALEERGRVIRNQLNQLEAASDAAVEDLRNGLAIACDRFVREIEQIKANAPRKGASRATSTRQMREGPVPGIVPSHPGMVPGKSRLPPCGRSGASDFGCGIGRDVLW